ncbi:periplasmic pilin chaperone [Enterobacterales bacterium 8AC]|nr:periplasmic pilin chaperone [Enterobacterales bacterium 8AC]
MKSLFFLCSTLLLSVATYLFFPSMANAAVSIDGTRIVYPAKASEITIKMVNKGNTPSLMQIWIDRGNPETQPYDSDVAFVITPPIVRIDPKNGQSVRLMFTGEKLPQDRETLFWFNALEIPPVSADQDKSSLQIAVRSRLKLFYRPAGLAGDAASAPNLVKWHIVPTAKGGYVLRGQNPTPYYVTYSKLNLQTSGQHYDLGNGMIAPLSSEEFSIKGMQSYSKGAQLIYRPMSDYGVGAENKTTVH